MSRGNGERGKAERGSGPREVEAALPVPGRQTLVQQSAASAPAEVQRRAAAEPVGPLPELPHYASIQRIFGGRVQAKAGDATGAPDVHAAAAEGISGPATRLPHLDQIQQSFGKHDVSHVQAHVGEAATVGSKAMGAEAFATGDHVAFAGAPSLHIAAHEAAHVVQQSGGVQLAGGVGKVGDTYEQHADQVADLVVQGKSAETLLDRHAGAASASRQIQRFGSQEHQSLGDTATGTASYNVGGATDRFELTHGDIVALSGDYFLAGPGTTAAGGKGQQDDLFYLASRPGNHGQQVGTCDEIIYTLKLIRSDDARFKPGGMWAGYKFPQAVADAVDARYKRLAAANTTHFAAPRGRDASGQPNPSSEGSAGNSYRSTHETALRMAFQAGQSRGAIDRAMAMEAAAQHYLTDSFSAGHLRTQIGDLRQYWHDKYPLFWYNVRHKIALDTAVRLNAQSTNVTTAFGTVNMMYEKISQQVEAMAGSLPAVTLGDLLAKIFHDQDNEHGLDVEGGGRMYGDGNLDNADPRNQTRARAQAAISDGNADVKKAYELGTQMGEGKAVSDADITYQVRAATKTGDRYLAETRMPVPVAGQPEQNWKAASLEQLWDRHVTGSAGATIGAKIIDALQPGHEIRDSLQEIATKFPANDPHFTGDLKPSQAYLDGFLAPLVAHPREGLIKIINWAPNYGLASNSRDDQSLASGQELDKAHQLDGMTTPARVAYVKELLDGYTADSESALIVRIFETAPAGERRAMYKQIEGHDWSGEFKHGWTVSDDRLWNGLNESQLKQLRAMING